MGGVRGGDGGMNESSGGRVREEQGIRLPLPPRAARLPGELSGGLCTYTGRNSAASGSLITDWNSAFQTTRNIYIPLGWVNDGNINSIFNLLPICQREKSGLFLEQVTVEAHLVDTYHYFEMTEVIRATSRARCWKDWEGGTCITIWEF